MKFFIAVLLFSIIAFIEAGKPGYGTPIKFKKCETVTTNAVKYFQQPIEQTTYVYSTKVIQVPSTFTKYITKTSNYVDYSTTCNDGYSPPKY